MTLTSAALGEFDLMTYIFSVGVTKDIRAKCVCRYCAYQKVHEKSGHYQQEQDPQDEGPCLIVELTTARIISALKKEGVVFVLARSHRQHLDKRTPNGGESSDLTSLKA